MFSKEGLRLFNFERLPSRFCWGRGFFFFIFPLPSLYLAQNLRSIICLTHIFVITQRVRSFWFPFCLGELISAAWWKWHRQWRAERRHGFHIQQITKHKVRLKYSQAGGFLAFGVARNVTGIDFKERLRQACQSGSKPNDCANVIAPHTVEVN